MVYAALKAFAATLQHKFSLPGSAAPEDQLKGSVSDLLKGTGSIFNKSVSTTTEAYLSDQKVHPNIAVYVMNLICGYIELKKPGLGVDAPKLKGRHNKE